MCARERVAPGGGEVVDDEHVVAALEELIGDVGRDEAGAACDQDVRHGLASLSVLVGVGLVP